MRSNVVVLTVMTLTSHRSVYGFINKSHLFGATSNCRLLSASTAADISDRLFPEEVNIIYDSKCNVCKLEIDFLRRRDERLAKQRVTNGAAPQARLRFTDLESGNYNAKDPVNGGVTYEVGMASMHAVTSDGKVLSGVPVFALAYEQVSLGWLFAITKIPWVKRIADKVYDIFAKYRTRITRGQSVESLIEVYRQKRALEEQQKADDCEVCQEKDPK